jgi:hypothetical protein
MSDAATYRATIARFPETSGQTYRPVNETDLDPAVLLLSRQLYFPGEHASLLTAWCKGVCLLDECFDIACAVGEGTRDQILDPVRYRYNCCYPQRGIILGEECLFWFGPTPFRNPFMFACRIEAAIDLLVSSAADRTL